MKFFIVIFITFYSNNVFCQKINKSNLNHVWKCVSPIYDSSFFKSVTLSFIKCDDCTTNDSICLFPTLRLDRFGFGDAQILTLQGKVLSICYNWNIQNDVKMCVNPYYLSWNHGWKLRGKKSNKRIIFKYREYKNDEDDKGIKRKSKYKILELSESKMILVKSE